MAPDAVHVETTGLSVDAVVERVVSAIEAVRSARAAASRPDCLR